MDINAAAEKMSQVLWRCRRGMLELDVMLENFCSKVYADLSPLMQTLFEELLAEEDQDLYRWLVTAQACDKPKFQDMLLVIRHMHGLTQTASVA